MAGMLVMLFVLLVIGAVAARVCRPLPAADGHLPLVGTETDIEIDSFTVGTFNIHRARGLDGRKDLSRVAAVIAGCDVVGLQEVEGESLFKRENQGETLARRLDCWAHFSPTRLRAFFPERGNALLSRVPVTAWRRRPLPIIRGKGYRNFTEYTLSIGDQVIVLINTHLSKPDGNTAGLEQVLSAFLHHQHAVLLGDFNAASTHPGFARLRDGHTIDAIGGTGDERVDHIFVRGLKVLSTWSFPAGPSDHPFFAARLSLL